MVRCEIAALVKRKTNPEMNSKEGNKEKSGCSPPAEKFRLFFFSFRMKMEIVAVNYVDSCALR